MIWEPPPPPPIFLWAAVAGIGLQFIIFLWGQYQRYVDKNRSIVDEFWYRTVILPVCWQPLTSLFGEYAERLHEMDRKASLETTLSNLQLLAVEFSADKNRVLGRCQLLAAFSDNICQSIEETLDVLEDDIAKYCGEVSQNSDFASTAIVIEFVTRLFWSRLSDLCKEMIKLHPQGKKPL